MVRILKIIFVVNGSCGFEEFLSLYRINDFFLLYTKVGEVLGVNCKNVQVFWFSFRSNEGQKLTLGFGQGLNFIKVQ